MLFRIPEGSASLDWPRPASFAKGVVNLGCGQVIGMAESPVPPAIRGCQFVPAPIVHQQQAQAARRGEGHRCYRFRTGARPMLNATENALYSVRSGLTQSCTNAP